MNYNFKENRIDSISEFLSCLDNPYKELNCKLSEKELLNLNNLRSKGTYNKKESILKVLK